MREACFDDLQSKFPEEKIVGFFLLFDVFNKYDVGAFLRLTERIVRESE